MSLGLGGLDPVVAEAARYAIAIAEYNGITVTVTSGYRSLEKQAELRANYEACQRGDTRGRDCRFPANRPGDSAHNFGLAFDSDVPAIHRPTWTAIRRWVGFRVPDNDYVHAEVPDWRSYIA
jgi:peptidoglycan L-alanyl-D-glutamate endopeptidase CwlK